MTLFQISTKGLIFGSILGTIFSGWLIIGQIVYKPPGEDLLPTNYTEGCDPFNASARVLSEIEASTADNYVTTMTTTTAMTITTTAPITAKGMNSTTADDSIDWDSFPYVLYRTSYMWISPFNFFFTFIATCLISIATGGKKINWTEQCRIHGNPVADGWAGAVGRKPLGNQKC